ncbi:MAG: class I SAM-dependent methyltransferase [Candidatus Neomarinimicrobiota bacterium]
MNDLEKYFAANTGRQIHKWKHYFEIYDRHFARFRGRDVTVVEFGVNQGGSLQMWKDYFGPKCKLFGIDINPHCKQLEEEQIEIFIGNQSDREFLKTLAEKIPKIDILIDDGGHTMKQQINTFEELFPCVDEHGVYLCEDLHTSYWPRWGGGYKKRGTYLEYSKNFIDYINAWHSTNSNRLSVTEFTRSVHSLHYYDSVLVIEKRSIESPTDMKTGTLVIPPFHGVTDISWRFIIMHPYQFLRTVRLNRRAATVLQKEAG